MLLGVVCGAVWEVLDAGEESDDEGGLIDTSAVSSETYSLLVHLICLRFPATPVHCCSDCVITPNSLPLSHTVIFFDYIVVEVKQLYAFWIVGWNWSSLVRVLIPGPLPVNAYGEVLEILQISQVFQNVGCPL